MTTPLTVPSWFDPATCEVGLQRQVVQHRSGITGTFQAIDLGVEYWTINLTTASRQRAASGRDEAFFNQLVGGAQPVSLWHFGRQEPKGTMRGSPTLSASAAQFAKTLSITTTGTLLAGDMIGVAGQLIQVAADATPIGGVLTIQTVNRVRAALASGSAVTWYRPTANFVMAESGTAFVHGPSVMSGSSFSFVEAL
jgi:hypothetical protein